MESIIQVIAKRCAEQVKRADDLLKALEKFGWKDTRPKRTNARKEEMSGLVLTSATNFTIPVQENLTK